MKLLALMAALALSAAAQTSKPEASWMLAHLAQGSEIRVTLAEGKVIRGFLQSAGADSLVIVASTSQERLAKTQIRRVQVGRTGHRGRNTLIGLAIGSSVGLGTGAAVDSGNKGGFFPNAGKVVFGFAGALVGTVVGVAIPTGGWREIYRAR
jgi:hypothetical protein